VNNPKTLPNELPRHVTSALSLRVFCSHLKTHLSAIPYPTFCSACELIWSLSHTMITFVTYLLTYLPSMTYIYKFIV